MLKHRHQYESIDIDAPNLGWLLTLMLKSGIELSHGEVVAAIPAKIF
jgi:hypothetical protein